MTVVSIPAGAPFLETLARMLLNSPTRTDDIVLLPTHRAGRALVEAFAEVADGDTLLLPRILSLGELDADEIIIHAEAEPTIADDLSLKPAISPIGRRLLLARLVMQRDRQIPPDRALQLAGALARLIDEVQFNDLDFNGLDTLVAEEFAEHWQETLDFLSLVTKFWPTILEEQGQLDPIDRRNRLYKAQIALWCTSPPKGQVVAAGSTGIMPATANLLAYIANLPRGLVVLPGLDRHLDDESWQALEENHPQWALKQLLERLETTRDAVPDWPEPYLAPRGRLVAEAMRPAQTTEAWRNLSPALGEGVEGLAVVRFTTPAAEAGGVALMLREAVEHGRSAALVTPDRDLARRITVELGRWGLFVDDSAGQPLGRTSVGGFLRLVAHAAATDFAPAALLAALKHPLAACGMVPTRFRRAVRRLERTLLRGPRPGNGLDGLLEAAERTQDKRVGKTVRRVARAFKPLRKLHQRSAVALADLLAAHVEAAENLAGDARLWRGADGEAAASLLADLDETVWPPIQPTDYAALFDELAARHAVRLPHPHHPGLAILGPLEGRLQRADRLVLAGLNQGAWPADPAPDPWMSREMRMQFGLPAPEVRQGLAAHDFAQALGAGEVVLTRSERVGTDPTVPSPWLQRLETVARALGRDIEDQRWAAWQAELDRPNTVQPTRPPRPCPPVAARPRMLSATRIQTWLQDPYSIYARQVLGLHPLDTLDADPEARQFGSTIHEVLERFMCAYPATDLPDEAWDHLLAIGKEAFAGFANRPLAAVFWNRRFLRAARNIWSIERERRPRIERILTEIQGEKEIMSPAGTFTLKARADRVELRSDGEVVIVDYKSGSPPLAKDVIAGTARQLPIEGLIAAAGGFPDCPAVDAAMLEYWRIGGGRSDRSVPTIIATAEAAKSRQRAPYNAAALVEATDEGLCRFIAAFDDESMPYLAEPRPDFAGAYNEYRHLSRKDEWSRRL